MKLKNSLHSSITLLLLDLNNFIKTRVTAKSSDLTSCLATEKHSNPYSKIGMHLQLINCRITSSDANLPILPKMAFIHVYHEFQQRKTYQNFGLDALHLCKIWKYLLIGSIFIRSRYKTWSKIYHNRVVRLPKVIANMWSGHQIADGRIRYYTTINIASVGDAACAISHAAAEICTQRLATGRGYGYRLAGLAVVQPAECE